MKPSQRRTGNAALRIKAPALLPPYPPIAKYLKESASKIDCRKLGSGWIVGQPDLMCNKLTKAGITFGLPVIRSECVFKRVFGSNHQGSRRRHDDK